MTDTPLHQTTRRVSFGHCDPAGIVYYPNLFRWVDETFHDHLDRFGGHAAVCKRLGSVGLGLIDVSAAFRTPMAEGDRLTIEMRVSRWGGRSLTLDYLGRVGARRAFEATEVRGVFIRDGERLTAGETAPLRAIID